MAVFEMCMPEKYLLQGYGPAETPTQEGDSDSAVAETCDHCLLRKNDLCLGINADISNLEMLISIAKACGVRPGEMIDAVVEAAEKQ